MCWPSAEVREKENEISAVKEMLTPALVKGRLLSADAMHTQRFFCQTIKDSGGQVLLIVKDNQPTMREDLEMFFEDPDADTSDWQTQTFVDKGHGRLEKRVITTSSQRREWFAQQWEGLEQVFRLERTVTRKDKTSQQVVYGFITLPAKQAAATQIAAFVRAHWAIENRSHWRRDVTMCEDHSQVRIQRAPSMLALLNSTVLALMDLFGVNNVPAQMRRYAAHPAQALHLLIHRL
jgi:predicted transposase YbfD/YdcC